MSQTLLLEDLYHGSLMAAGVVVDWRGVVRRRFEIEMQANWTGDEGTLEEFYRWDDDSTQTHSWQMHRLSQGQYRLTGTNIAGQGSGRSLGTALRLRYNMLVPVGKRQWHFLMDDWTAFAPDGTAINRVSMRKFGIVWGQVLAHIRRV